MASILKCDSGTEQPDRSYNRIMTNFQGRAALVTGASSGIGAATAVRLARLGCRVVLAARNRERLEEVRGRCEEVGGHARVVPTDVTEADQCRAAVETAIAHFGRLDIVVSCAGLSLRGYFDGTDLAAMERVMRVNFFGTLYMTQFALPHVKRSRGSLVAVTSLVGKRATPAYALYGASKFAVQGLYEALHIELKHDGVHVGVVAPAFVDTPLRRNALGPDGRPAPERPPEAFRIWPVDMCVDCIIKVIAKRKREALLPWFARPLLLIDQLLDRRLGDRILDRRFPPEREKRQAGGD
ncbi:MAG: SDR family oxidoreductase [Gemmataceae bacterium]|nr:SDR family oxidoreductase [Gemmataceae bacterium]